MKTSTYTLTLLALSIQVMVNGQIQGNQIHTIKMDIFAKPAISNDSNVRITPLSELKLEESLKEESDLQNEEQKLKEEVSHIQQKYLIKKIEVSLLRSNISYEKYLENRTLIASLQQKPLLKATVIEKSETLSTEAQAAIKAAKEMREEANAQLTPEAQLAEMSNAEEKETLALTKQQEAINLLGRTAPAQAAPKNNIEFNQPMYLVTKTDNNQQTQKDAASHNLLNTNITELVKQLNSLKSTCQQLREVALNKQGYEKQVLLEEAIAMEKDVVNKQIEIAVANYKTTCITYYNNKILIDNLLQTTNNESISQKALLLSSEAEYAFRLGKEMREEANAQFTAKAKIGEISNAEEQEKIALSKQQETVSILKKHNPDVAFN